MDAEHWVLLVTLAAAAWTDARRHRIPNVVTYTGLILVLVAQWRQAGSEGVQDALAGAVCCGGVLFLAWLPGAIGGGDVKLAAVMGAAFGWINGLAALLWMFTLAAAWMLSWSVWQDGAAVTCRRVLGRPLPATHAAKQDSTSVAPAALAAAIFILSAG
jgi:Flp pilus assembly protein protease CpaA